MTEHEVRPVHDYVSEKWNNVSLRTKITGVTVLLLLLGLLPLIAALVIPRCWA